MTHPSCGACRHFDNASSAIERSCRGLTALSSAYGSTRGDDGICSLRDLHVSVADRCVDLKNRKIDR
jgi:hypothetical protein